MKYIQRILQALMDEGEVIDLYLKWDRRRDYQG